MTDAQGALFDSHAHLTFEQFAEEERGEVLERARAAGVLSIMNIATDISSLEAGWKLQQCAHEIAIYCAAATTPHDVIDSEDLFFPIVEEAAHGKQLAAIGETGLDFFYRPDCKKEQEATFLRYALLAQTTSLPLIVHCRDAFPTLLGILRDLEKPVQGILHCFTGTTEDARALIEQGWYISFSGILTYPKSESLRQTARCIPMDRLLVETDSPYLAPQQKRGQRNEPAYLRYTVEAIAAVKNASYEEVALASFLNAEKLFSRYTQTS